jgi:hypothetical protein
MAIRGSQEQSVYEDSGGCFAGVSTLGVSGGNFRVTTPVLLATFKRTLRAIVTLRAFLTFMQAIKDAVRGGHYRIIEKLGGGVGVGMETGP